MVGDDLRRDSGESASLPTEVKEVLAMLVTLCPPLLRKREGHHPALLDPREHHVEALLQGRLEIAPLELVARRIIGLRGRAAGVTGGA